MKNRRLIDLSHTVRHGMITYKGLPGPEISDYMTRDKSKAHYAEGTSFHIGQIKLVANTGTYIDSPFHRYSNGKDLSQLDLSSIADVDGILFEAPKGKRAIEPDIFGNTDLKGKAVLVYTGWASYWGTEQYYENHPFLTRSASEFLVEAGAAVVGIDSYNIDDTADLTRPAHSLLLHAGIPIVEHMCNLESLTGKEFRFFAVPVKIAGFGTFPVRTFALISD